MAKSTKKVNLEVTVRTPARDEKGRFLPKLQVQCTKNNKWYECRRVTGDGGRPVCPACGARHKIDRYRRADGK